VRGSIEDGDVVPVSNDTYNFAMSVCRKSCGYVLTERTNVDSLLVVRQFGTKHDSSRFKLTHLRHSHTLKDLEI
jgi:hypothetical protein